MIITNTNKIEIWIIADNSNDISKFEKKKKAEIFFVSADEKNGKCLKKNYTEEKEEIKRILDGEIIQKDDRLSFQCEEKSVKGENRKYDFNEQIRHKDERKVRKEYKNNSEIKKNVNKDNYNDNNNLDDINTIMRRLDHVENREKRTR